MHGTVSYVVRIPGGIVGLILDDDGVGIADGGERFVPREQRVAHGGAILDRYRVTDVVHHGMACKVPARDITDLAIASGIVVELELNVRIITHAVVRKPGHVASQRRGLRDVILHVDLNGTRVDHVVERIRRLRRGKRLVGLDDDVLRKGFGRAEIRARIVEAIGGARLGVGIESTRNASVRSSTSPSR